MNLKIMCLPVIEVFRNNGKARKIHVRLERYTYPKISVLTVELYGINPCKARDLCTYISLEFN